MIAVRSWERAKGLTRIEFVAGIRALTDYRRANKSAREIAALFSTGRDDAPALAAHMLQENKELNRRVRILEEVAASVEAQNLLGSARLKADGTRVIAATFDSKDIEALKKIAHSLTANPRVIALLGARDNELARLVFARSADVTDDMNVLMKEACAILDGKGGGSRT
jgi:alanyl-tRNA synthetase